MSQAKTLTSQELRRVTDYVATRKHAARNRAMLLVTHLSGMRVGEVAALRVSDVLNMNDEVRNEMRLDAEQTKGQYARVVFGPPVRFVQIRPYPLIRIISRRCDDAGCHWYGSQA